MIRIAQFLLPFCFLASSVSPLFSQDAPCLRIRAAAGSTVSESSSCSTMPAAGPFVLPGNQVDFQVYDNPRSLNLVNQLARYKAFWIFGDGNFAFFPHGTLADDLSTNAFDYQYHKAGTYNARAVLSEKKSNDEPPKRTAREIQVNSVAPGSTTTPFKHTLSGTVNSVDILNSEVNRPKHPTAFSVSAPKLFNTFGMFFFYNSSNTSPGTFTPSEIMAEDGIELPWYMKNRNIVPILGRTVDLSAQSFPQGFSFNGALITSLSRQYNNFIFIDLNPVYGFDDATGQQTFGEIPESFDEFRFFPVLKTTLHNGTLPTTRFAAIALSRVPVSKSNMDFFDLKRLTNLNGTIGRLFLGATLPSPYGAGSISNNNQSFDSIYITGAQILDVEMKASIDPNKLEVLKICPKSNGQYEVRFRVEVCNQGYMVENAPEISLKDPYNLVQNLQMEGTVNHSGYQEQAANPGAGTLHNWSFVWNTVLGKVPEPGDPESDFQEQCAELFFTANTDWAGVQKLVDGSALEMCVVFPSGGGNAPECHYNYALDASKISREHGYECGTPPIPTSWGDCCYLYYMLILIISIILLWWILKGRQMN